MQSRQLQSLWAVGCAVAALLANWVGGFSMVVTAVFAVLLLTGATLIGQDEPVDEAVDEDFDEAVDEAVDDDFDEPVDEGNTVSDAESPDTEPEDAEPYPDDERIVVRDDTDDSAEMVILRSETAPPTAAVVV